MNLQEQSALLRILALMAMADGSVEPQEQEMMQCLFDKHFLGSFPTAWRNALADSMDLRTAALAIPVEMRPVTIKLSYLVNAACGEERDFPINPAEVYSLNALVNHLELTEDEKENAINAANDKNLFLPLSFGAKGSAQVGGVVSTNAGGLRVFRYGMTRQMVLGLEAVLPDGTIISSMKKIIKDNSGYDLKQLFIGSEGTLGIVTRVVLRLIEKPSSRCSALVGVENYDKVLQLLKHMDKGLGGTLSGFELMWQHTYETMTSDPSPYRAPIPQHYPYYVFIEVMGEKHTQDIQLLEDLVGDCLENEIVLDGMLAQTDKELNALWQIREDVAVLAAQAKDDQHFDISLPIPKIGSLIDQITADLKKLPVVDRIFTFGHVADGNIHFIIGKHENNPDVIDAVNALVYKHLKAHQGSVSAEHGIGLHKKKYLNTSRSEVEIELMQQLKQLFDPKNILNPGRIVN